MIREIYNIAINLFQHVSSEQFIKGFEKYGVKLTTFNGRDAGLDAFQELADLTQYVTQLYIEYRTCIFILKLVKVKNPALLETIKEEAPQLSDAINHIDSTSELLEVASVSKNKKEVYNFLNSFRD